MTDRADFRNMAAAAIGTAPVAAVEDGARRLVRKRLAATEAFAAMDAMRDRAREIRLHTLANLDTYLAEFVDSAEAAGCHVHFADNDAEARSIVMRIASEHDVAGQHKLKRDVGQETAGDRAGGAFV